MQYTPKNANFYNFFPKKCNFKKFSTSESEKYGESFSQFFFAHLEKKSIFLAEYSPCMRTDSIAFQYRTLSVKFADFLQNKGFLRKFVFISFLRINEMYTNLCRHRLTEATHHNFGISLL